MNNNNIQNLPGLRQEYNYFEAHRKEFAQKYLGLYLIIQSQKALFVLNTLSEAIDKALEQGLAEGTYLLQYCDKKGKGLVCPYCSQAYFK